jgi:lysozyme
MANLTIREQRKSALSILERNYQSNNYEAVDYLIDDACRKVLNLQPRPDKALPFVGWMVGAPKIEAAKLSISTAGLQLIASFEGCKLQAYLCPANVWTIGYGHTSGVRAGQKITQKEANELFAKDLERFEIAVTKYVRVPLTQGQYDALVSLCYNIGCEAFRKSTLLKSLNEGKYKTAALQFHRWVNANGKKLPGLVRRRNEEYGMFAGG